MLTLATAPEGLVERDVGMAVSNWVNGALQGVITFPEKMDS
jgi:hypothetical protein